MGIDLHVLNLLHVAKGMGCSYHSTIMIGRQNYASGLSAADLSRIMEVPENIATSWLRERFAESCLQHLGAERIESIDNSDFEKATIMHDMNQPIGAHLRDTFTCVLDGGSIEHIFNFPQAIKNCMEMLSVGGHFIEVTAANNFMGHGFYQFSPELYYRVLSSNNGFEVREMFVCETSRGARWYRVADPANLGRRVELVNNRPTYIMVLACKVKEAAVLSVVPQQSDYEYAWGLRERPEVAARRVNPFRFRFLMSRLIPSSIRTKVKERMVGNPFRADDFQKF